MDVEVDNAAAHVTPRTGGWLDKVLPVSALFVSFLSILLAWGNGEAMQDLVRQNERLVQANSLPYLQLYGSNVTPAGEPRTSFVVANQGIGPAEVRTAEVLVDGKPQPDLLSLLKACCGDPRLFNTAITSTLNGQMIRQGERINFIDLAATGTNGAALNALDVARRERIETRLCYCSVFEECWIATSGDQPRPRKVDQCPAVKTPYRQ